MARLAGFTCKRPEFLLLALVPVLMLFGCRSNSRNRDDGGGGCCGGGGGGCCRGTTPNNPSTAVVPPASPTALASNAPAATMSRSSSSASQSRYGGQKTCPITGEPLGSMGDAIPVTAKGQTVYVCCRGCVAKVQRDPDGYLRKVQTERGEQSHGTL